MPADPTISLAKPNGYEFGQPDGKFFLAPKNGRRLTGGMAGNPSGECTATQTMANIAFAQVLRRKRVIRHALKKAESQSS